MLVEIIHKVETVISSQIKKIVVMIATQVKNTLCKK